MGKMKEKHIDVLNSENTDANTDKPWLFKPGQSGNPTGKPKGAKNKVTKAVENLLGGESEALTRKAVDMALAGDTTALKLCLDRISPTLKPTAPPIALDMPPAPNLTNTARTFVSAAASGDIPPDIAAQLVSAVASVARVEEVEKIKYRLESLENVILRDDDDDDDIVI